MIYLGDGMSTAHFMSVERISQAGRHAGRLADSAFELRRGTATRRGLLASLANQTGGMLVVDGESIDPKQAGAFLASAATAAVLWPRAVTWPKGLAEVYPAADAPVAHRSRYDRGGQGRGRAGGRSADRDDGRGRRQAADAEVDARRPSDSNPDFAFLARAGRAGARRRRIAADHAGHARAWRKRGAC